MSYRADAGPGTDGQGGPFSFGRVATIAQAEAASGRGLYGVVLQRLVGGGSLAEPSPNNYMAIPGPVGAEACPPGPRESWRGDAGSSSAQAGWTSTLYNHAIRPDASPSCIAEDGRTARMGASSGHARRVNVLLLGGSVRGSHPTSMRRSGGSSGRWT